MPSFMCCHGNQQTMWPASCLCVCTVVCLWQNGRMCVCARAYTPSHLGTPSSCCLFHFPRQFVAGFGLPEDYAIGRPSLMPRHATVHSSAPQGMFTFQKLSMWTSPEREKSVLRLVEGTECDCCTAQLKQLKPSSMIRYSCRENNQHLPNLPWLCSGFLQAKPGANRIPSPVPPCFVFWVLWLHLLLNKQNKMCGWTLCLCVGVILFSCVDVNTKR